MKTGKKLLAESGSSSYLLVIKTKWSIIQLFRVKDKLATLYDKEVPLPIQYAVRVVLVWEFLIYHVELVSQATKT